MSQSHFESREALRRQLEEFHEMYPIQSEVLHLSGNLKYIIVCRRESKEDIDYEKLKAEFLGDLELLLDRDSSEFVKITKNDIKVLIQAADSCDWSDYDCFKFVWQSYCKTVGLEYDESYFK